MKGKGEKVEQDKFMVIKKRVKHNSPVFQQNVFVEDSREDKITDRYIHTQKSIESCPVG